MVKRRAVAIALGFLAASCASGHALVPAHPERVANSSGGAAALIGSSHSVKLKGFHVMDVAFVDDRHGFALGGFASAPIMAILRTPDGGRHWKTIASTPHPEAHIEFSTPRLGWAYGPDLYVTTDGGQSWEQERAGGPAVAVAAQGRSVWVVTGACHSGLCTFRVRVSDDTGQTWRTPALPAAIPGETVEIARSGSSGWILSSGGNQPESTLLVTTDDGATWAAMGNPCHRWVRFHGWPTFEDHLAPADSRDVWLLCLAEPSAGSTGGRVFQSLDGGRSWHSLGAGPWPPFVVFAAASRAAVWAAEQDDDSAIWRLRFPGGLRPPGLDAVRHGQRGWVDLQFMDAQHGWAATASTVFRTADGGANWTAVHLHPSGCG